MQGILAAVLLCELDIDILKGLAGGFRVDEPDCDGEPHVEDGKDDVHLVADVLQCGRGDHDDLVRIRSLGF